MNTLSAVRQSGCTMCFTTHDQTVAEQLADEIWELRGGRLHERGDGPPPTVFGAGSVRGKEGGMEDEGTTHSSFVLRHSFVIGYFVIRH